MKNKTGRVQELILHIIIQKNTIGIVFSIEFKIIMDGTVTIIPIKTKFLIKHK